MQIKCKKETAQWEFAGGKRSCPACGTAYDYYQVEVDTVYPCCLECERCRGLGWYFPEQDWVLDKYFPIDPNSSENERLARIKAMREKIEAITSPCTCGGNYHHVNHTEYGFPRYCPGCGASQMTKEFRHMEPPKPFEFKRIPVARIEFYEA